jgi:hypothetical protein
MRPATLKSLIFAVALTALSIGSITNACADRFDDIASSPMSGGRPTAAVRNP